MNAFHRSSLTVALVIAAIAFAPDGNLLAQTETRFVEGTVTDQHGQPIDRAAVQLKDTYTLYIRSFMTTSDGKYHFSGLRTDIDYELVAQYDGIRSPTRTLSQFDSRPKAVIDLTIRFSR